MIEGMLAGLGLLACWGLKRLVSCLFSPLKWAMGLAVLLFGLALLRTAC